MAPAHPSRSRRVIASAKAQLAPARRPIAAAVGTAAVLRLVAQAVAMVSAFGLGFLALSDHGLHLLIPVWNHWDSIHYLSIARHGYPAAREVAGKVGRGLPPDVAFAPLYPVAIAAAHAITGTTYLTSGQIVSGLAVVASFFGLYRLVERDHGAKLAGTAVALLAAFPSAFFLLIAYPEALSLAAIVWAFVAARRGSWLAAGILLAAATMTKFYPVVFALPLLVELNEQRGRGADGSKAPASREVGRAFALLGPSIVAAGAWMAVCAHLYGDPLASVHVQSEWEQSISFPWTSISRNLYDTVHLRILNPYVGTVMETFDLVSDVAIGAMAVYVFRHVRRSYGVLLAVAWCVFTFQTVLVSETRQTLVCFPFFIGLARLVEGHPWRERCCYALFLPASYFLIQRFVTNRFAG